MEAEIIINNEEWKMIAEFMGDEPEIEYIKDFPTSINKNGYIVQNLVGVVIKEEHYYPNYESDWGNLMTVVDKIKGLGWDFILNDYQTKSEAYFKKRISEESVQIRLIGGQEKNGIESVYQTVCKLINFLKDGK